MGMLEQIRDVGMGSSEDGVHEDAMNVIEYVESDLGLGFDPEDSSSVSLHPVQKFILKCYYGLELESQDEVIKIPRHWKYADSAKPEHYYQFTEQEYLQYLYDEGRSNISEIDDKRRYLILPVGRRSGKTFLSSIISSYETYKLLRKGNPQRYYGLPEGAPIHISNVATSRDQAKLMFDETRRHYRNCEFFDTYLARSTQSYVNFQTPHDLRSHGNEGEDDQESVQIKFFSSVSKGIRGTNNIVVVLDEAAFFPTKGEKSAKAVYKAASPSLAAFSKKDPEDGKTPIGPPEGKLIMISSPHTREGLFYEQYEKALSGYKESEKLLMIRAPTWEVNPTVSVEYYEGEFHNDPEAFWSEFGSEFTSRVKSWIDREEDLTICIDKDLEPKSRGVPQEPHYLGIDLAAKGDRTALVLTKPKGDHVQLVYHELWQAGVPWDSINPHLSAPMLDYAKTLQDEVRLELEKIADWVQALSRKFYIEAGEFDSWEGISFQQSMERRNLDQIEMVNFTRNDTSRRFHAFKQLLWHERMELYDYVRDPADELKGEIKSSYMKELMDLEADRVSKNIVNVEAPDVAGKYDDFADALVRSVWLSLSTMLPKEEGGRGKKKVTSSTNSTNRPTSGSVSDARQYRQRRSRYRNYVSDRG